MSVGTDILVNKSYIYFRGIQIRSMSDLNDQIDECVENISHCKEKLKMMAAATPKDIFPPSRDNDGDCLFSVNKEFDSIWEWLTEERIKLERLKQMHDLIINTADHFEQHQNRKLNLYNKEDFEAIVTTN